MGGQPRIRPFACQPCCSVHAICDVPRVPRAVCIYRPGHLVLACGLRTFERVAPTRNQGRCNNVVVLCGDREQTRGGAAMSTDTAGMDASGVAAAGGHGVEGASRILQSSCLEVTKTCRWDPMFLQLRHCPKGCMAVHYESPSTIPPLNSRCTALVRSVSFRFDPGHRACCTVHFCRATRCSPPNIAPSKQGLSCARWARPPASLRRPLPRLLEHCLCEILEVRQYSPFTDLLDTGMHAMW